MGEIHFNHPLFEKAFGDWVPFQSMNAWIPQSGQREHHLSLKDKFGLDLNLSIDPLQLEERVLEYSPNIVLHTGVTQIRLGYSFSFD